MTRRETAAQKYLERIRCSFKSFLNVGREVIAVIAVGRQSKGGRLFKGRGKMKHGRGC